MVGKFTIFLPHRLSLSFVGTLNQINVQVLEPTSGKLDLEGQTIQASKAVDNRMGDTIGIALLSRNDFNERSQRL